MTGSVDESRNGLVKTTLLCALLLVVVVVVDCLGRTVLGN